MRHKYFGNIKLTLKNMGFRGTATSTASYKKYGDRLQNRGVTPDTTKALHYKNNNSFTVHRKKVQNPIFFIAFLFVREFVLMDTVINSKLFVLWSTFDCIIYIRIGFLSYQRTYLLTCCLIDWWFSVGV